MSNAKQKLISWLNSQLGYREICDNNTKYADADYDTKLYGFDMHGKPWCDYFVDYAFIICFGYEKGTAMTYQTANGSAACAISAANYKQHGAWHLQPEIGDQIFFYYSGDINHTGVVVELTGNQVITIEGNSSDMVRKNTYNINDNSIAGYGRPNWSLIENDTCNEEQEETETDVPTRFRRTYIHLEKGDGMNNPDLKVKLWQQHLKSWGYELEDDGEFGDITHTITTDWQKLCKEIYCGNVEVNGVVDEDDWIEIVKIPY